MSKVTGEGWARWRIPSLCRVTACNELEVEGALLPFIHDAKSRLTVSLSQDEASLTLPPSPSRYLRLRERDYTSISRSYVSYFVWIEGLLIRWLVFRDWPGLNSIRFFDAAFRSVRSLECISRLKYFLRNKEEIESLID